MNWLINSRLTGARIYSVVYLTYRRLHSHNTKCIEPGIFSLATTERNYVKQGKESKHKIKERADGVATSKG